MKQKYDGLKQRYTGDIGTTLQLPFERLSCLKMSEINELGNIITMLTRLRKKETEGGLDFVADRRRQTQWWHCIIANSRTSDTVRGRRTDTDYIDKEFLLQQQKDQHNCCFYCMKKMVSANPCDADFIPYAENRLSIERVDNDLPHVKDNCLLACLGCNRQRNNRYSFEDFYVLKLGERKINRA